MSSPSPKPAPKKAPQKSKKPKGFFMRGLGVVLPAVLTVFVFITVFDFVRNSVAAPINRAIYGALDGNALGWSVLRTLDVDPYAPQFLLAEEDQPEAIRAIYQDPTNVALVDAEHPVTETPAFLAALSDLRAERATWVRNRRALGIDAERLRIATRAAVGVWAGVLIAAFGVLFVGYLASGFLGRSGIAAMHRLGSKLPLIRSVYPYTKQLVDFFMSDGELEFDSVVAAPYPSDDTWSIGFVTGPGLKTLHGALDGPYLAVYMPSSPLPMTGFTVFIEASKLIPLELSVEEALRLVVTAGVVVPPAETVEGLADTMTRLGVPPRQQPDA